MALSMPCHAMLGTIQATLWSCRMDSVTTLVVCMKPTESWLTQWKGYSQP